MQLFWFILSHVPYFGSILQGKHHILDPIKHCSLNWLLVRFFFSFWIKLVSFYRHFQISLWKVSMNSALQCNKQHCTINPGSERMRQGKCHTTPITRLTPTLWSNAEALSQIDNRRLKAHKTTLGSKSRVSLNQFSQEDTKVQLLFLMTSACWISVLTPCALLIMIFPSTRQIPTSPLETPLLISPHKLCSSNYFYWVRTLMTFDYIHSTQCPLL